MDSPRIQATGLLLTVAMADFEGDVTPVSFLVCPKLQEDSSCARLCKLAANVEIMLQVGEHILKRLPQA